MYKLTSFYLTVNHWLERTEKILSVILISSIVIIVFTGTLARYFLEEPFFGADRLAAYLFVWLGFLGFQMAVSKMRHIEIEAVKSKMKEKIRCMFNTIACLIASAFLSVFCFLAFEYMNKSRLLADEDIMLGIPIWQIILIIPLSFFISALRYVFNALLWIDILTEKRKQEDVFKKQIL